MDNPSPMFGESLVPFIGNINCEETKKVGGNKEDCYGISIKCQSILASSCYLKAYIYGGGGWGWSAISQSLLDCNMPNYGFCRWHCQGGDANPDITCVMFFFYMIWGFLVFFFIFGFLGFGFFL